LVLISNHSEKTSSADAEATEQLLARVMTAERTVASLTKDLRGTENELSAKRTLLGSLRSRVQQALKALQSQNQRSQKAQADVKGLELVESTLKRASVSKTVAKVRDEEVGGIPVDSDYVVFIVDTSGSMKQIWGRVTEEIENVIKIHPKIKGFQILNDNGAHLLSGYQGRWIPDTPSLRKSVIKLFRTWNSASNSSPVEGLEVALKRYANLRNSVSIYIFGDDYSGSSYDPVINALVNLNTNRTTGKQLTKVHAIGFISQYSTKRFPILMREVTRRNGGTFIALPR
jgi:hypothetical protein